MAKLYIDTNIYLDFYRSATEPIALIRQLEAYSEHIVMTEQTVDEFFRNRNRVLNLLIKEIEVSSSIRIHTTSAISHTQPYLRWKDSKDTTRKHAQELTAQVREWQKDGTKDAVLAAFVALFEKCTVYVTNPDHIDRAKTRKLLGMPPTSPDKHTIGDEVIWETLIDQIDDDIVIVSRDITFSENALLLSAYWSHVHKGKRLFVDSSLSDGLRRIGKTSATIDKAESEIIVADEVKERRDRISTCPKCNGPMYWFGTEGSDSGEVSWLVCGNCGHEEFPAG